MRKSFMYATMAAAALFASCSSHDDLSLGNGGQIDGLDGDNVAIKIGVGSPVSTMRGTGAVGGVSEYSNGAFGSEVSKTYWAGQKINVYMLKHETMQLAIDPTTGSPLYENAELTAPTYKGTFDSASEQVASGEAKLIETNLENYNGLPIIKYYPLDINQYDFWGYRVDDANITGITKGDNDIKVEFTVDGTQDVLAAQTIEDFDELSQERQDAVVGGKEVFDAAKRYSASAARKGVQPELLFKHMMTRLTFDVKAGTQNIAEGEETPVCVTGISVRPIKEYNKDVDTTYYSNTGTLAVAWVPTAKPAEGEQMVWKTAEDAGIEKVDGKYAAKDEPLVLKRRLTESEYNAGYDAMEGDEPQQSVHKNYSEKVENLPLVDIVDYSELEKEIEEALAEIDADEDTYKDAEEGEEAAKEAAKEAKKAELEAAYDLVAHGAVALQYTDGGEDDQINVGESIIAPDADAYELIIDLAQELPQHEYDYGYGDYEDDSWAEKKQEEGADPDDLKKKDKKRYKVSQVKVVVKSGDNVKDGGTEKGFLAGWSYKFICTVYGLEQINITTTLEPWKDGGSIDVDPDVEDED